MMVRPPPSDGIAVRARLLIVGTELLGGAADANGPLLCRLLKQRGVDVASVAILPDDRGILAAAIVQACSAADIVVITGGLGPTPDDITREAVTDATGLAMVEHAPTRERIETAHAERGREPGREPGLSLRQALLPDGAVAVPNVTGSAVGAVLPVGDAVLVMLPGPPRELEPMVSSGLDEALRIVARHGGRQPEPRHEACVVLGGIGEGEAARHLASIPEVSAVASVVWLARAGEVRVVVVDADAVRVTAAVRAVSGALGRDVVSTDGRSCAEVVLAVLRERGETLAVAESCTGGLLASMVTAIPGSSDVFRCGLVTYANDAKVLLLGVTPDLLRDRGAVSAEVALAMAGGARRAGQADFGIGITGIAGPGGATEGKPVGLVHWAVAGPDGHAHAWSATFSGSREDIRQRAAAAALEALRRRL